MLGQHHHRRARPLLPDLHRRAQSLGRLGESGRLKHLAFVKRASRGTGTSSPWNKAERNGSPEGCGQPRQKRSNPHLHLQVLGGTVTGLSKRSASYLVKMLSVLAAPLVLVSLTASAGSAATATAPTYFGAKLTSQSQPSNAENGQPCSENGGIPHGATCTWGAISAVEDGRNFTAPRTGTIKHVKLISCVAGKLRLQLA